VGQDERKSDVLWRMNIRKTMNGHTTQSAMKTSRVFPIGGGN